MGWVQEVKSLKSLQDFQEETWRLASEVELGGVSRSPKNPREIILLLHGLNERGRRIYRKCLPYLPPDALILAPNGVFTIPHQKADKLSLGYAWYFFDRIQKNYLVNQDQAVALLLKLIEIKNPTNLPVTIIGFSQGGYLAPILANALPETRLVIGIGCEFMPHLVGDKINYPLEAIHGTNDQIIKSDHALKQISELALKNIKVGWHPVEDAAHEINQDIGIKIKELLEHYGKRSL